MDNSKPEILKDLLEYYRNLKDDEIVLHSGALNTGLFGAIPARGANHFGYYSDEGKQFLGLIQKNLPDLHGIAMNKSHHHRAEEVRNRIVAYIETEIQKGRRLIKMKSKVKADRNDWRLQGQEKYLKGAVLNWKTYDSRKDNDHDHCEFCQTKFMKSSSPDTLHEGYTTPDEYRWICKTCFDDFKEMFELKVKN